MIPCGKLSIIMAKCGKHSSSPAARGASGCHQTRRASLTRGTGRTRGAGRASRRSPQPGLARAPQACPARAGGWQACPARARAPASRRAPRACPARARGCQGRARAGPYCPCPPRAGAGRDAASRELGPAATGLFLAGGWQGPARQAEGLSARRARAPKPQGPRALGPRAPGPQAPVPQGPGRGRGARARVRVSSLGVGSSIPGLHIGPSTPPLFPRCTAPQHPRRARGHPPPGPTQDQAGGTPLKSNKCHCSSGRGRHY